MSLRTSFKNLIRRDAERPNLRGRAAGLQADLSRVVRRPKTPSASPNRARVSEIEPDPALAVVTVFRASWDALGKVLDAEAPDALVAELEDAQSAAYDHLRAVRPTTPEGCRALAACWAMVLKGHRGDEPGMMVSCHAADSLIVGANACVPAKPLDWYEPPPGFIASPALVPSNFFLVAEGIARELARLRGVAFAELNRRTSPGTKVEDIRRIRRELHLDTLSPRLPRSNIVDQVDFAAAGTDELRAIHERVRELSNVAYGMAARGCCEGTAAGNLMHWLADELTAVEGHAGAELQRRQPISFRDQRTRLGAVTERIIQNGDDAETAGFIQELTV